MIKLQALLVFEINDLSKTGRPPAGNTNTWMLYAMFSLTLVSYDIMNAPVMLNHYIHHKYYQIADVGCTKTSIFMLK